MPNKIRENHTVMVNFVCQPGLAYSAQLFCQTASSLDVAAMVFFF